MFAPEANVIAYRAQFQSRMRGAAEDAHAYSLAIRELAHKAYPAMDHQSVEQLLVDQFIRGQPQHMRVALATSSHTELQSLVATAIRLEAYARSPASPEPPMPATRRIPQMAKVKRGTYAAPDYDYCMWDQASEAGTLESEASSADAIETSEEDPTALVAQAVIELLGEDALAVCLSTQPRVMPDRICFFCRGSGHFFLACPKFLAHIRANGYRGSAPGPPARTRPAGPWRPGSSGNNRPNQPPNSPTDKKDSGNGARVR
jgi:hypothetical protein